MSEDKRPILGISVGDPGGIGPEITVKALNVEDIYDHCRPLVVADHRVMEDVLGFSDFNLKLNPVQHVRDAIFKHGTIDVLDMNNMPRDCLRYKEVTPEQGRASFEYVAKVIELATDQEIDGTVTGPINKAAINAAGHHYAGHTEIYAALTDTRDYSMMLSHGNFRVTHVSTHVSLRQACDLVKKERVIRVIDLTYDALKNFSLSEPRIGVAGLNPHCGEEGMFGYEDDEEILPAVEHARKKGYDVEGPIPADTIFSKMKGGMYDAVVVMYHDQGHIPMKFFGFQYDQKTGQWGEMSGVNITLGLPIVRTSVDHGTAFGKAGEGRANPQSMIEAIKLGALLSRKRR
ncbi:4-hydroxythreonine-4-phosphate dehydrogenase (EC [Olavius sp. associated proteobacterium Delta 1]|nr:4-hydroxythreonine-4-phosphate dehydrogenase (EC [Olavius sp. associated proteobacterium Delta 1]